MNQIIKNTLVLTIILVLVGLSLGLTYETTKPKIDAINEGIFMNNLNMMFPEADRYEANELYKSVYSGQNLVGFIAESSAWGFSSDINVMVGVNRKGDIIGVKVLSQQETPGIGSKVADESFLGQFTGKKGGEKVDTITGATVSSSAALSAINEAVNKIRSDSTTISSEVAK